MTRRVQASCHCGAVEIFAELLGDGLRPMRCTCSFCRRRQAGNVSAQAASLIVAKGADALTLYQFGTRTAEHLPPLRHLHAAAGRTRANINIGCIAGEEPWTYEPMGWSDGIHHPSDRD